MVSLVDFQLTILSLLARNGRMTGKDLREEANAELRANLSGPSFYSKMAHMEEAGLVKSEDEPKKVGTVEIKVRIFEITEIGKSKRVDLTEERNRAGSRDAGVPDGEVARSR